MAADLRKPVSGRTSWDAASWAAEASEDMDSWREASRRLLVGLDGKPVAARRRIGVETLSMLTPEDLEAFRSKLVSDAYAKGAGSARAKAEGYVSEVLARVSDRWGAFASAFRAPERPRTGDPVEAAIDWTLIVAKGLKEMAKDALRWLIGRAASGCMASRRFWPVAFAGVLPLVAGVEAAGLFPRMGLSSDPEFVSDALTMAGASVGSLAMLAVGRGFRPGGHGRVGDAASVAVSLSIAVAAAAADRFARPLPVMGAILVATSAAAGVYAVIEYVERKKRGRG